MVKRLSALKERVKQDLETKFDFRALHEPWMRKRAEYYLVKDSEVEEAGEEPEIVR